MLNTQHSPYEMLFFVFHQIIKVQFHLAKCSDEIAYDSPFKHCIHMCVFREKYKMKFGVRVIHPGLCGISMLGETEHGNSTEM